MTHFLSHHFDETLMKWFHRWIVFTGDSLLQVKHTVHPSWISREIWIAVVVRQLCHTSSCSLRRWMNIRTYLHFKPAHKPLTNSVRNTALLKLHWIYIYICFKNGNYSSQCTSSHWLQWAHQTWHLITFVTQCRIIQQPT